MKIAIAVLGGDQRELILAGELVKQGYDLSLCGFSAGPAAARLAASPQAAVANVQAVVLPLAGINEDLTIPSPSAPVQVTGAFFRSLPRGLPLIIGWAPPRLKELTGHLKLIEATTDDELAVLNSIPTAEGAIAIAMEAAPVTIHGSRVLVTGYGRCGASLARMAAAIGAIVHVATRKPADRARALEMGFHPLSFDQLPKVLPEIAFIFNTVPAPVLTQEVLAAACPGTVIVDIASGGGTDFAEAAALGLKAFLAPGLPGKVAPVTAGRILARVYPRLLKESGLRGE